MNTAPHNRLALGLLLLLTVGALSVSDIAAIEPALPEPAAVVMQGGTPAEPALLGWAPPDTRLPASPPRSSYASTPTRPFTTTCCMRWPTPGTWAAD